MILTVTCDSVVSCIFQGLAWESLQLAILEAVVIILSEHFIVFSDVPLNQ